MATSLENAAFTSDGEYFAFSNPDGRLKLWETSSGILKQEYTPSSHLSSTCSCLSWCSEKRSFTTPKKKRKKIENGDVTPENQQDIIAMGTTTGNILFYSFLRGELVADLKNGHNDKVNDVCWNSDSSSLFSCSNDQHVIHWNAKNQKIKYKWKASRHSVYAISFIDENNLISASSSIKWWNLSTREVIKKFTGHATEIFRLLPVRFSNSLGAEGSYFLSVAKSDRVISAWQLRKESDSNSLASFSVVEELVQIDASKNSSKNQPVTLTALTESGTLHVFEHQLNGKCKRPLMPKVTLHVTTEGADKSKVQKLPILSAAILPNVGQLRLIIAYGSFLNPKFEEVCISGNEPELWLIRDDPSKSLATNYQQSVSKIKQLERPSSSKVLIPGHMVPLGPVAEQSSSNSIRKRRDSFKTQTLLPMEVRLDALVINDKASAAPTTENLTHLLLQGLQSTNLQLLDTVLQRSEDNAILNTVRRLPITAIVPLLRELQRRLRGRGSGSPSYLKWLKTILVEHASYLTTCGEIEGVLGPLAQLFEGRCETFPRISQLKGKLSLMLSQISSKDGAGAYSRALVVYNDVSSEDEDIGEDKMGSHSTSEDNWSDLDMELEENNDNSNRDGSEEESS